MYTSHKCFQQLLIISLFLLTLRSGLFALPVAARSLADPNTMTLRLVAPTGVAIGATLSYLVEVNNDALATDALLTVTLPAEARYLSADGVDWECTAPAGTTSVTCHRSTLPATGTTPSTIRINTIAPTTTGEIRASAAISEGGSERARTDVSTSITATTALADLQVELTAPAAVEVGPSFTVQLRVLNNGTSVASNVQLTASISPYVSSHFAISSLADCSRSAAWVMTCNFGTIAPGGAVTRMLVVEVPVYESYVPLTVGVSSATAETNLANNAQTINIPINRPAGDADARIRSHQLAPANPVAPGALVQYNIEPGNWGPQGASLTTVATAPAGFTVLGASSLPGWLCDTTLLTMTCTGDTAALADYYANAITMYALAPTTLGPYTVNVGVTGDRGDPLPANNSTTLDTVVAATPGATADLAVTTNVVPATAAPGSHVAYTVHVRNDGAATANAVRLFVPLFEPSWRYGIDQAEWTGPIGWECVNWSNQGFVCQKEHLSTAEGEQVLVFHLVAPATAGVYSDRVGVGSAIGDSNPTNNVANSSLTVATGTPPAADLALNGITYDGQPHAMASGTTVRVRLKLLNRGPNAAPDPILLLRVPTGWSFGGVPSPTPWDCSAGVQTLECHRSTFAPTAVGSAGEEFDFDVVAPSVTSRTYYVLNVYFNSSAWNSFSFYESHSGVGIWVSNRAVNLRITANDTTFDPSNVGAGFQYAIHVLNIGSQSAAPIGVIADIPGSIALVRAVRDGRDLLTARGPGWRWGFSTNDELAPGAEMVITLYVQAPSATGHATSRFTVYSGDIDTDLADNVAVEDTTFTIGAVTADLRLTRTPAATTVCAAAPISYTLAVANQGTEGARDLNLVENVPAGISMTSAFSTDMACMINGGLLICRRDDLGVGPVSQVLISGRAPTTPGLYSGFAGVSGSTADNNTADNLSDLALNVTACTAGYTLDWWTVDGGGQTFATGGVYELGNTTAQPDAGALGGGTFTLNGGFWYPVAMRGSTGTIGPEGGEVSYKGSTGIDLDLRFPSGATADPLKLVVAEGTNGEPIPLVGVMGNAFSINAYTGDGTAIKHFSKPFVLTVQYDATLLNGSDENKIMLAYWDVMNQRWTEVVATLDRGTHTFTAELDHLTTFAVRQPATSQIFLPIVTR